MWLPLVITSTPASNIASRGRWRQAHAPGHVLAVRRHEVDAAVLAQAGQHLLHRDAAGLADEVADHQDAARPVRSRRIAVGGVPEACPPHVLCFHPRSLRPDGRLDGRFAQSPAFRARIRSYDARSRALEMCPAVASRMSCASTALVEVSLPVVRMMSVPAAAARVARSPTGSAGVRGAVQRVRDGDPLEPEVLSQDRARDGGRPASPVGGVVGGVRRIREHDQRDVVRDGRLVWQQTRPEAAGVP